MSMRLIGGLVFGVLALGGCAVMERYHMPVTQADVPVAVLVAYSEDHPNHPIKSITMQKMFNERTHYKFLITDAPNHEAEVVYDEDGKVVPNAM